MVESRDKNKGEKTIQTSSINPRPSSERARRDTLTVAWAKQRVEFTVEQQKILERQGLSRAQVNQLQIALPRIRERLVRPLPIASVREELRKLKKALSRVENRMRVKMPKSRAGAEALTRLYQSQSIRARTPNEMVTLQDLLRTANDLVDYAIAGTPRSRGRIARSSPKLKGSGELITLISRALQSDHAEDHYGRANSRSVPARNIRIGHNSQFSCVAGIVSEVTGNWSVEEAIKAYRYNLKQLKSEGKRTVR